MMLDNYVKQITALPCNCVYSIFHFFTSWAVSFEKKYLFFSVKRFLNLLSYIWKGERNNTFFFPEIHSLSIWFSVSFLRKLFFTVLNHMALLLLMTLCVLLSHNIKSAPHLFQNRCLMPLDLDSRRALDWVIHAPPSRGTLKDTLQYFGILQGCFELFIYYLLLFLFLPTERITKEEDVNVPQRRQCFTHL